MIIVQLTSHFTKDVCCKVFKDSTLVPEQIPFKYAPLRTILKHGNQKSYICHVHFEFGFYLIPIQRQFRYIRIVTSTDYASILDPLEASFIITAPTALANNRVLEFLIFTCQLAWNGFETFSNPWFVSRRSIFDHICLILVNDSSLYSENLSNLLCVQESLDCFRMRFHYF